MLYTIFFVVLTLPFVVAFSILNWELEKSFIDEIFGLYVPWWVRLISIYFVPIILLGYIYFICMYIFCIVLVLNGSFFEVFLSDGSFYENFKNWLGV